jgi:hypothetical protein
LNDEKFPKMLGVDWDIVLKMLKYILVEERFCW